MAEEEKEQLTPTQQEIVDSSSKRLLVLSCAGSGKTRVVVSRIEKLVNNGVDPKSILALTFSNRAAQEMKNRLTNKRKEKRFLTVGVKTFHAFGYEIIRDFSAEMGFKKRVSIADPSETDSILKTSSDAQKIFQKDTSPIRAYIRGRKNFEKESDESLEGAFTAYEKALRERNILDLDDLIYLPVLFLEKNEDCLHLIQNQYKYIFVDEYQDTSEAQNRFLDLIVGPQTSLFLVGDDDQSIYEWRGAHPEYIREKAKSGLFDCYYLTQNFRSEDNICQIANEIIKRNQTRVDKTIHSIGPALIKPTFHKLSDQQDEAKYVADEIQKLLLSGKFNPSDIAVLYRNNDQEWPIKSALDDLGINAQSLDVDSDFKYSRFVKVLKSIVDFHSSRDLSEALNFPTRFFDQMAFEDAKAAYEEQSGEPLPDDAMKAIDLLFNSEVTFPDCDLFRHRYSYIHQLHYATDWSATQVIGYLISDFEAQGYLEICPDDYHYLQQVFQMAEHYEEAYGKSKLSDFLTDLLIAINNNDEDLRDSGDAVALLTLHRSKGLEFKAVFIVGLQVGIFPNDYFIAKEEDLEAERRLLYVGVTRAKDLLYLTSFKDPLGAPANNSAIKCGFLAEIPFVLYSRNELPVTSLALLPSRKKVEVVPPDPEKCSKEIAATTVDPLAEKDLFETTGNLALSDEDIVRYQNECLALSQQIKISRKAMVVVIGALDVKKDVMYAILKSNGFGREQVEYYDYKDSKLNYKRYANNANYVGLILGPNAHSQVGGFDLLGILKQDGFPFLVDLVKKHITKSSLQMALIKIKLNIRNSDQSQED